MTIGEHAEEQWADKHPWGDATHLCMLSTQSYHETIDLR